MGDFSVHAERVEAFLGFFSIIRIKSLTPALLSIPQSVLYRADKVIK
jgi:hypothetical protein